MLTGRLSVHLGNPSFSPHIVFEAGDCVGEMSILDGKPGSVIVDSSDYNEKEARKLAEAQCAKSKRRAKQILKPNATTNPNYHFKCI